MRDERGRWWHTDLTCHQARKAGRPLNDTRPVFVPETRTASPSTTATA
jgi:hypothetical protein